MGQHISLHASIRALRASGKTYTEINSLLNAEIPKSSLSYICREVKLPDVFIHKMRLKALVNIKEQRIKALATSKKLFKEKVKGYRQKNLYLATFLANPHAQKVALAIHYLGEGAKWKGRRGPALGSSSPQIIQIYINLLKKCYGIQANQLKCRIQCRADQDKQRMLAFWSEVTGVLPSNFYPTYTDKRTVGKPTRKLNYMGVCVVTCAGTHIQLELEQITDIISEALGH